MNELGRYLVRTLHHKRLGDSTGAIAGLASGLSVLAGLIAAHFAPRGFRHVAMTLHLAKPPLILKLAPFIAGVAVAFATASGLLKFYTWYHKTHEDDEVP
jgi:hypothetical protein